MATTASARPTGATRFVIDTAKEGSDQALALYRQAARFSLEAAGICFEALTSMVPGAKIPPVSVTEALTGYVTATFDVAEKAVQVQREIVTDAVARLQSS